MQKRRAVQGDVKRARQEKMENQWVDYFWNNLNKEGVNKFRGQGKKNKLPIPNVKEESYVQFGDFRIETGEKTLVVELDTQRGLDNLIKYWPYLVGITPKKPAKKFILLHVYGPSFPSNKELWRYILSLAPRFAVPTEFHMVEVKNWNSTDEKNKVLAKIQEVLAEGL